MAAPAPARIEPAQKPQHLRFWAGLVFAIIMNLTTVVYTYGKLSQQVQDLDHDLQNLHEDVRTMQLRSR